MTWPTMTRTGSVHARRGVARRRERGRRRGGGRTFLLARDGVVDGRRGGAGGSGGPLAPPPPSAVRVDTRCGISRAVAARLCGACGGASMTACERSVGQMWLVSLARGRCLGSGAASRGAGQLSSRRPPWRTRLRKEGGGGASNRRDRDGGGKGGVWGWRGGPMRERDSCAAPAAAIVSNGKIPIRSRFSRLGDSPLIRQHAKVSFESDARQDAY